MSRLEKILRPRSIAVIGASRKEGSLGKMFLEAILRMHFTGKIFPVNPKAGEINGIKTYPNVQVLPQQPDLAVILLPHQFVLDALREVGRAGIRNVIVVSAGFKEVGGEGIQRERELVHLARQFKMNLLGPNCMGIFNTHPDYSFNGTFSPTLPRPGHVAYVSQSGALGVAILELSIQNNLGFSIFVSTGNKADITDDDVMEFLIEDENTKVVTLYLEGIDRAQEFRNVSSQLVARKPVLAVKAGRTGSGLKAASSHTGALANPEYIVDGFLKQSGVLRFDTLQEMFDAARALAVQPLPRGSRVAILTNAGGPGILASDAVEKNRLQLAELSSDTRAALREFLPAEAAIGNPVDMIASANQETYTRALQVLVQDDNVDAIVLIMVKPPVNCTPKEVVSAMAAVVRNTDKTIIPVLMAQKDETAGLEIFMELNLPVFDYPEAAVRTLAAMWRYKNIQREFSSSSAHLPQVLKSVTGKNRPEQMPLAQLLELLNRYELPLAPYALCETKEQVFSFWKRNGRAITLKIANEEIIHKSDRGLLRLNLNTEREIEAAFTEIRQAVQGQLAPHSRPILLAQLQMKKGLELVLGGKRDEQFGPVLMAGLGGIFVEALKDVVFRVVPVTEHDALHMLDELKAQPLLNGFRGQAGIDRRQFVKEIVQISRLLAEHPEIVEMDLNPLIWQSELNRAVIVDARATIVTG